MKWLTVTSQDRVVYFLWFLSIVQLWLTYIFNKKCRQLKHIKNRLSKCVELDELAANAAQLGIIAYLRHGDHQTKYDFIVALQQYDKKLQHYLPYIKKGI